MTRGGVHPGPGRTRGGALAIRLAPERKIINFEQHHKIIILLYYDINMKLFMQLVSIHRTLVRTRGVEPLAPPLELLDRDNTSVVEEIQEQLLD